MNHIANNTLQVSLFETFSIEEHHTKIQDIHLHNNVIQTYGFTLEN